MNIGITGANGFVGRHLIRQLLSKSSCNVYPLTRDKGFDIINFNSLLNFEDDLDLIIHLAAKTFTPDSYQDSLNFINVNSQGTANIAELARIKKAKLIYLSSYVYGEPEYLPIDEDHPVKMFNPYSSSKLLGENVCKIYSNLLNVPTIIIRPFNIYGPGQSDHFLISKIINGAKSGSISLNDPRPKRDYLYIDDLVSLIIKCLDLELLNDYEIINAGSGISYSIEQIVQSVKECFKGIINFNVSFSNLQRPNEVLETIASIDKAKQILDWKPNTNINEGLRKIVSIELNSLNRDN